LKRASFLTVSATELQASAAVAIPFDPIELPSTDGGVDRFVDGDVSESAIRVEKRVVSRTVRCRPQG